MAKGGLLKGVRGWALAALDSGIEEYALRQRKWLALS